MKNLYSDQILGEFKLDKKQKNKKELHYVRSAKVKIHKDYSVKHIDPKDFKEYWVWGDVIVTETKIHNVETGHQGIMRSLKLTKTSEKSQSKS